MTNPDHETTGARSLLGNLGDWIADQWPSLTVLASTVILVYAGAWLSYPQLDWSKIDWRYGPARLLIIGAVIGLIGTLGSLTRSRRITELHRELAETATMRDALQDGYSALVDQYKEVSQDIIRVLLVDMANDLGLGDSERISLYAHNGEYFVLAGRYSKHPEYHKPGREFYPDNQGCIGNAWRQGKSFADNLPDPQADKRQWSTVLERDWQIPRQVSKAMAMKSRCIAAYALDSAFSQGRRAVVVIESVLPTRFSERRLDQHFSSNQNSQLVRFLEIMETFEPNPDYARSEGY